MKLAQASSDHKHFGYLAGWRCIMLPLLLVALHGVPLHQCAAFCISHKGVVSGGRHGPSRVASGPRHLQASAASIDPGTSYFDWLGRQLELKLRPPPYPGFRLRVDRDLAVLLMRSSYQVTDELDFIAMDQFQKSFFLLRQKEWPDYLDAYPPLGIRQGELSDPNYFDFISAVQYATIAGAMTDAPQVFVEKINADGETQIVRRDPALQDNAVLPLEHSKRVGDRILQRCLEAPSAFRPDISANPTIESLTDNVRKIMDLFTSLNFNAQSSVEQIDGRTIKVMSDAPANLWSLQWLSFRGEKLINDYEAKAITSLFRACGLSGYTYTRDIKGKTVTYTFRT